MVTKTTVLKWYHQQHPEDVGKVKQSHFYFHEKMGIWVLTMYRFLPREHNTYDFWAAAFSVDLDSQQVTRIEEVHFPVRPSDYQDWWKRKDEILKKVKAPDYWRGITYEEKYDYDTSPYGLALHLASDWAYGWGSPKWDHSS